MTLVKLTPTLLSQAGVQQHDFWLLEAVFGSLDRDTCLRRTPEMEIKQKAHLAYCDGVVDINGDEGLATPVI